MNHKFVAGAYVWCEVEEIVEKSVPVRCGVESMNVEEKRVNEVIQPVNTIRENEKLLSCELC